VPLPWAADEPGFGFSPTGVTWLPQPASWAAYALDAQRGVPGSTYETYRAALATRRAEELGTGGLAWITGLGEDVIAFENREVVVVANLGSDPVPLPDGLVVIASSAELTDPTTVPGDTTLWARHS
jgi:alpha-glucosidase